MRAGPVGMSPMLSSRRNLRAHLKATTLPAVLLLALAGCSTTATHDPGPAAYDHRLRHPIMVSEEPEVFEIPVGMNGPALSREIEAALRNYVDGYRDTGTGFITIQVPTASANANAAAATGQAVHYALVRAGVDYSAIQVAPYHVGDYSKAASLRVSYLKVKAVAPTCGVWPETLPNSFDNKQYHNFGCAGQQNLAAMVANPADFIAPRPMTPANGARRAKVITDYSKGEETKSNSTLPDAGIGN
jgi:pilus assembly protein CpaD